MRVTKGLEIMPKTRNPDASRPPATRSRVTNGRALFVEGGDERSPFARRFRDLVASHAGDLGGVENLSEAERSLIRRAAALGVQCEALEAAMSRGEHIDLDLFGRLAGHQRRVLETLGIRRVARDVTPTARTYLTTRGNKNGGER